MTGPHTEGVFYTVRIWDKPGDDEQATDIFFCWTREGTWDPRLTEWEVGALEAEERLSALEVFASFIPNPWGAECPTCGRTAQPHCSGCAACPGQPHPWWCHGDTCICGCPKSRHYHKMVRGVTTREGKPYTVVRQCRGRRCVCRGYKDVESQAALLVWLDCTDEERAERRAVLAAIIQEFVLGLGIFESPCGGLDV
jgi:hypothetical protein